MGDNFTKRSMRVTTDALRVFASNHNLIMGIDVHSDNRPNIIKYVFYHLISGKGALIIVDFMQVEHLDKSIDTIIERLTDEFNGGLLMHIVIFCGDSKSYREVSNKLLLGICNYVNCRTRHNQTVFEIDEKDIVIDIRPGDILKAAGLRPDYVLFYNTFGDFFESWEYCMKGRYIKLKSLDELIQLVVR